MILLRTHHPSFHPSHLFKLTESLKGLSWPQLPFWLNRGQLLPWHAQVLAGLTSHLWIQACQSLVSSPPMALTRKRSGSRAEGGRRKGTSDMEGGGEGENRQMDDCWAAGARYEKKTCTLVGGPLISRNRTPTWWCPIITDWLPVCSFLIVPASVLHSSSPIWLK